MRFLSNKSGNAKIVIFRILVTFLYFAAGPMLAGNLHGNLSSNQPTSSDSLRFIHHRGSLNNSKIAFQKFGKGRVVFLGGSITNMNGWRQLVMEYLQQEFPETEFDFINAGIPSTGSVPGAFRLERDVFSHGPVDLLFEEAAVNDRGRKAEEQIRGMEGIIRQARMINPKLDIVMMHFVDPSKMVDYNQGIEPSVIANHEKVAEHYQVTSINLAKEVTKRIGNGEFIWENDFKDLHPAPFGHRLYCETIREALETGWSYSSSKIEAYQIPEQPLDKFSYFKGKLIKPVPALESKTFRYIDSWIPGDSAGTRDGFVEVPVLESTQAEAKLKYNFKGTMAGIFVVSGPDAGIIEYKVDQQDWQQLDLYTQWSGRLHLPKLYVLADELTDSKHNLRIRVINQKNPESNGHACRIAFLTVNAD